MKESSYGGAYMLRGIKGTLAMGICYWLMRLMLACVYRHANNGGFEKMIIVSRYSCSFVSFKC